MRLVWLVVPTVPALVAGPVMTPAGGAEPQQALTSEVVRFEPVDPSGSPITVSGRPYRGGVEGRRSGGGLAVVN